MTGPAQGPTPITETDPHRFGAGTPGAIGRVLNVVRKLVDYGKQLATTVQQHAATPRFALFAKPFGTAELAVILARITNGLRRAAALEARLCQRVERGRDLTLAPVRAPTQRTPGAARQVGPPDAKSDPQCARSRVAPRAAEDPRLARLPTEEEIAAEVRRRPVGAVIVDICRDLGIAPGQLDRTFWNELSLSIISYGGSLAGFFADLSRRLANFPSVDHTDTGWPAAPKRLPAPATGPP
jgi:hypothetical protein